MARVAGLEPAITVLETAAFAAKLHRQMAQASGIEPEYHGPQPRALPLSYACILVAHPGFDPG
jgi:hypothetical protein